MSKIDGVKIEPLFFRMQEACEILRLSRSTIYKMNAEGRLRFSRIGGRTLVPREEIERLRSEARQEAA